MGDLDPTDELNRIERMQTGWQTTLGDGFGGLRKEIRYQSVVFVVGLLVIGAVAGMPPFEFEGLGFRFATSGPVATVDGSTTEEAPIPAPVVLDAPTVPTGATLTPTALASDGTPSSVLPTSPKTVPSDAPSIEASDGVPAGVDGPTP
jgi:hypothetical protein